MSIIIAIYFCRDKGSVIAKMNVILDKAKYEKGRALKDEQKSVKKALEDTVSTGRVGALTVDPDYLVFEPLSCKSIFTS